MLVVAHANHNNIVRKIFGNLGWPLFWGMAAWVGFYALVHRGVIVSPFVNRYFAGHPVEYIEMAMFFVGMAALALQAFSVAGYRKGFKDERGNLFFQICRAIDELKHKPKVLMLENVKNLKGHDKGKTARVITNSLRELGYSVFWNIFNTSVHTEIPQNRERTFIICFKDEADWEFSNKNTCSRKFNDQLPLPKSKKKKSFRELLENREVEDKFYYKQDAYMYKELKKEIKSRDTVYQWRRVYVRKNKSNECPTLTANMGTGGHNVPLILDNLGIRKLTPRECLNFQGFPKSFKFPETVGQSQRYKQAGNAVTVHLIERIALMIKKSLG